VEPGHTDDGLSGADDGARDVCARRQGSATVLSINGRSYRLMGPLAVKKGGGPWSQHHPEATYLCPLHFSVELRRKSTYVFRVGNSPPLSFSFDDVTRGDLRFLDPGQSFDPKNYVSVPR
jgi:hypothetical protein